MRIRSAVTGALAVAAALPAAAGASPESDLGNALGHDMRAAGRESGSVVRDETTGKRLFAWNAGAARILASNTKLFTLGATLAKRGPHGTIATRAMAAHVLRPGGVVKGNLYLVGGGDPTFGSQSFVDSHYGGGHMTVERLADKLYAAGLRAVRGHVVGDESLFDSLRGGPSTGYRASRDDEGPLTGLVYNHGLTSSGYFQSDPPSYAAARPIAGVDGTLAHRMTSGYAHHNCRAKTGTLNGVSALSGYCRSRSNHILFFSILMNGQSSDSYAHSIQDDMAQHMAGYKG